MIKFDLCRQDTAVARSAELIMQKSVRKVLLYSMGISVPSEPENFAVIPHEENTTINKCDRELAIEPYD